MDLDFFFPFKDVCDLKTFLSDINRPSKPFSLLNNIHNLQLPKFDVDEDDDVAINTSTSDQCSYITTDKLNDNVYNSAAMQKFTVLQINSRSIPKTFVH